MHDQLIKMALAQVHLETDNRLYKKGIMRLGAFIEALGKCSPDKSVIYDFYNFVPTDLNSYRGYYDHLALGFSEENEEMKAGALLVEATSAMGRTYEGYKGGDFTMDADTPLWVGNYGQSRDTAICGITEEAYNVVIHTTYVD